MGERLAREAPGTSGSTVKPADQDAPRAPPSIRLLADAEVEKTDSKAESTASAARERNRAQREAAILAGLDHLEIWLTDQIDGGMAAFATQCHRECRALAQRLVDAKAAGLQAGWSRFRRGSSRCRKRRGLLPP